MAASKAVKKTGRKKSVAKKVAEAAGAARKAVREAVEKTAKKAAKKAGSKATKKATAKKATAKKATAKKATAKKATAKKAVKVPTAAERAAARKAKKAVRKAERAAKKAERVATRAAKKAPKKVAKKVVKKVTKRPAAKMMAAAEKAPAAKAARKVPVKKVARQVAEAAKRVMEAAGGATKRASSVVKKAVTKRSRKVPEQDRAAAEEVARPEAREQQSRVVAGDSAPAFELYDQDDAMVSSESLAGQAYVLYFYPKDNTPGCTREAQGFRDEVASFGELGVRIIGVSPDSARSHRGFSEKHGLAFTLLADPERVLAKACGAYGPKKFMGRESMGIIRSTFLVDTGGKVRRTWRGVRVDGHVAEVLEAARELAAGGDD